MRPIRNPFTVPWQSATNETRKEVRNLLSICLLLCKGKIEEKNVDPLHAYKAIKQVISPLHTINALTFQGNITLCSNKTVVSVLLFAEKLHFEDW